MVSDRERLIRQESIDSSYSYDPDPPREKHHRRREQRKESYESDNERRHRRRDRDRDHDPERKRDRDRRRRARHRQDTLDTVEGGRRRYRQDTLDTIDDRSRDKRRRPRRGGTADTARSGGYGANPFDSPPAYDDDDPLNADTSTKHRYRKDRDHFSPPERNAKTFSEKSSHGHDEEKGEPATKTSPPTEERRLTKLERFGGPWIYIIPILAAYCLLAAATCSSDWWRKDVNIVKVGLPIDVYGRVLATGTNQGKSGGDDTAVKAKVKGRAAEVVPGGWLSVGFWGWCVSPEGDGS